jgi:hypothetical protein
MSSRCVRREHSLFRFEISGSAPSTNVSKSAVVRIVPAALFKGDSKMCLSALRKGLVLPLPVSKGREIAASRHAFAKVRGAVLGQCHRASLCVVSAATHGVSLLTAGTCAAWQVAVYDEKHTGVCVAPDSFESMNSESFAIQTVADMHLTDIHVR